MDGLDRWRILRLHVEDDIPLTALARETGTALRTLERWHHLYKSGGIAALEPQRRTDAGTRRTPTERDPMSPCRPRARTNFRDRN